ncbi:hypothetical protein [Haloechinothrix salitolerans]|uniref:Uncharacterized protein n=1 Tax=Haloechinothrix salitolerans TaxID=926830 RepID=A0ABW2C091_9PSEU
MAPNRRCATDVFWNLATLMDDFALELPSAGLTEDSLRSGCLAEGSRICLSSHRDGSPAEVTEAAAEVVIAGMRPVVTLAAPDPVAVPDPAALDRFDRALDELAAIGVRELVLVWPARTSMSDILDDVTRIVHRCDPGGRGFVDIGVANVDHGVGSAGHSVGSAGHSVGSAGHSVESVGHGVGSGGHELSADLLRAFEDASAACVDNGVGVTLLTPLTRSAESVVGWERSLRAAGNLFPVRVRLPGVAPSPFRRTVPALLGMAAAAESDPGCLISEVQFVLRGSAGRTAAFAEEIRRGNFVVEDTDYGYRLSMLREGTT